MNAQRRSLHRSLAAAILAAGVCLAGFGAVGSAWAAGTHYPQQQAPAPTPTARFGAGAVQGAGVQQEQSPDIIGGREAEPGAWPWQVALVVHTAGEAYNGFFCGGSLIAPDWVLTAAHCLDEIDATLIDVLAGAHLLTSNERRIQVDRALIHPDYSAFTLDGDLGLLHLSEPVTHTAITVFTPGADGAELDYLRGTVTGWGNMDPVSWFGVFPDALQEVSLPLIDYQTCARQWGFPFGERQICAGYSVMNKAVCNGDSGGPLMIQKPDGQWRQIGIVSAGQIGCAGGTLPDIFTRAGAYKSWIDACMQNPDSDVCVGADTFEPDDRPPAAHLYATYGVTETRTFHQPGDQDWIKFDVKAGARYQIRTQHVVTYTAPVDTVIWLFGDTGHTPLAYNDDFTIRPPFPLFDTVLEDSGLDWRAQADGTLYLSVENNAPVFGTFRPYGPKVKYALTIVEYPYQAYLPAISDASEPDPTLAPAPTAVPTPRPASNP